MVTNANKKLKQNTEKISSQENDDVFLVISIILKKTAPDTDGIARYMEYVAALILSSPKKRAPEIHNPALLDPGINANNWKNPIIKASKIVKFSIFLLIFDLSAKNKIIAKKIVAIIIVHLL